MLTRRRFIIGALSAPFVARLGLLLPVPMRGSTGLMGEAGPEAILPLTRWPDGRLGVSANGGSAGPMVTINISTPDIEGFQRSRGQIASQLALPENRAKT